MASIREKISTNAQPLLAPGEQIQAVIPAQTKSGWLGALGAIVLLFANRYQPIVVTDRRILITDAGRWGMAKPRSVVAELPRSTAFGTPKGMWWKWQPESRSTPLYIHKRFHKDVEQADAKRATG